VAVEALEAVQDSTPDRVRQPQASRQIRADLAVRPRPLSFQPSDACRAAQRPQPRGINAQACQELQRLVHWARSALVISMGRKPGIRPRSSTTDRLVMGHLVRIGLGSAG
jgi:hypothetical protein